MVEPETNITITQPETTVKELSLEPQHVLDPSLNLYQMTIQYENIRHTLTKEQKAVAMAQISQKRLIESVVKPKPVESIKPVKRPEPTQRQKTETELELELIETRKRRKIENERRIQRLIEQWHLLPPEEKERRKAEAAKRLEMQARMKEQAEKFEKTRGHVPTFGQRLDTGELAITATKTLVSPNRDIISDAEYTLLNDALENVIPDTALIISSLEKLSNLGLLQQWLAQHPKRTQELIEGHFLTRTQNDVQLNTTGQFAPFSGTAHRLA